jgi:hypothetical protein
MRFFTLPLILSLSFVAAAVTSRQDEERRLLDPSTVPAEGRAAADFIPRGWKTETDESEFTGDLNKDALPDKVLRLVEDKPVEASDGTYNERSRALIIIFGKAGGGFTRAAVATRLLGCTLCAGMLGDPAGGNISIEIKNGVLNVSQLSGAREATDLTQRFRYDAASKRFLLIGEDVEDYDRLSGESTNVSTNYLTGLRVTKKSKVLKEGQEPTVVTNKSTHVALKRRFIEDVDYEQPGP